jgi:succinoglycan biosynthesis protein ExoA
MTATLAKRGHPREHAPPPSVSCPFISVIVPVLNEARFIRATLEQLLTQEYDPDRFEILVADGRSTDDTRTLIRALQAEHPQLILLDNPGRLSSAGRNVAIRQARGDILVIVDGHCDLGGSRYLRELADAFDRSDAACVGRPQPLDVVHATPLQRAIAAARSSCLGHHPASFIYSSAERFVRPQSVAVAYRREVFETVGLFDENFDACEDVEFNERVERAGLRCFFSPRVQVQYHPRATLRGLFRQMARYGRGRMRLLRKHPATLSLACLVPALFVLGLVAGPLLALASVWLAWAYFAAVATYAFAVMAVSIGLSWQARDVRLLAWLPAVFAAIHGGAGIGFWIELLSGSPPRRRTLQPFPSGAIRMKEPLRSVAAPATGQPILNALTVDVEDYFQVSGFERVVDREQWDRFAPRVVANTERILALLDNAGVRATFFVLGWVAVRHPGLVRAIQNAGHEIGCHSYWHRLIYQQTPAEFREDLCLARDAIQDVTGTPVTAYRAPSFSITRQSLWALDILIEEGFQIDSSIYPTHHDRYGIAGAPAEPHWINRPAGQLWEFPMPIYRCLGYPLPVGGGGYFRLYPYALTRHGLRTVNAAGRPFVFYLHPWEVDPEQPRLPASRLRKFRHYVNLHRTETRLAQLLRDFRLGTLTDVTTMLHGRATTPTWDLAPAA